MAKRKTPKTEKIVDLASANKIDSKELVEVQQMVNALQMAQRDLGMIESRKHALCHDIMNMGASIDDHYSTLTKKYNCSDIDINTGTLKFNKDADSDNKKDNNR